ncbi:MAG: hypothetical protein ACE5H8_08990 [Alphaproteobacteria bacterium]
MNRKNAIRLAFAGDVLFLANMLVMRREGRADTCLPADRLGAIPG